jgi:O-antigen/teichoic acid export membrane protein
VRRIGIGSSTTVGGAFVVSGLSSYVVLVMAKRSLDADEFGAFSIFWSFGFLLASLAHSPVEQELSRSIAVQLERGVGTATDVRHAGRALAIATIAALVAAALLLLSELVGSGVPGGLLAAVCVLIVGEAVAALIRGEASGRQDTGGLASVVAVHGLTRALAATIAAVVGWHVAGMSMAVALAGVIPAMYVPRLVRRLDVPHSSAPRRAIRPEFAVRSAVRLGVSTPPRALFAIGMPVLAAIVATASEQATIGDLLAALSLTSAPVLVAAALQFVLLPRYATWIERDDHALVRTMTRRMLASVAIGVVVVTAVAAVLGTWALDLLFGATEAIDSLVLALMTFGAGALFLATLLMPVVIATRRYRAINWAWYAGAVVTFTTACIPIALAKAIAFASALGPTIVVGVLVAALMPLLRAEGEPTRSLPY